MELGFSGETSAAVFVPSRWPDSRPIQMNGQEWPARLSAQARSEFPGPGPSCGLGRRGAHCACCLGLLGCSATIDGITVCVLFIADEDGVASGGVMMSLTMTTLAKWVEAANSGDDGTQHT